MQRLEVSGAVRLICKSLGVKGLDCQNTIVRIEFCTQIIDSLINKYNLYYRHAATTSN